ncbi:MAG TPA: hypothetical protein VFS23_17965 [Vicinamibacterales bacterium]|nr:hypothetical protein [Vicinamibacterales bacterium]
MTVAEEVEQLKLRFENLSGLVPEEHPCAVGLQGWFKALAGQAQLLLIVCHLQAIIEAKTGSDVGEEQDLTLLILDQLREAAAGAEDLALSGGLSIEAAAGVSTTAAPTGGSRGESH